MLKLFVSNGLPFADQHGQEDFEHGYIKGLYFQRIL